MSEVNFLQFKDQFPGNTIEQKIKKMAPVELVLATDSVYPQKGKVELAEGQFNKTTGTINFRATFPNAQGILRSGNTGKIRIARNLGSTIVIPQEATFEIQDKTFVYLVADSNKILTRPITISGRTTNYYYVSSGINVGDKIVLSSQSTLLMGGLRDGMPITPQLISADSVMKAKPL
jgi:membrane fusion protein (multidrug efflux system)